MSCSSSGVCTCKSNVVGTKCTACQSGYFGFPNCRGKNLNILKILILELVLLILKCFQLVDVALQDPHQHLVAQVEYVLANQMLLAPNVHLVSQDILDFPIAKVKIKTLLKY